VIRVAEEAQLYLCWPESHKSVAMHELGFWTLSIVWIPIN
jgi:hypothetical protein